MQITSPAVLSAMLRDHGLRPLKQLGQNFLIDANVLDNIADAARLTPQDNCLEIGPGAGGLTQRLCRRAGKVLAVELDRGMLPLLRAVLRDEPGGARVTLVQGDILEVDLPALTRAVWGDAPFTVAANLPYYITTPAVFALLESGLPIQRLVLLMQREVAERLCAAPGGKDYGALSVAVGYACRVRGLFSVPAGCFFPRPNVASRLVELLPREGQRSVSSAALRDTLRVAFAMRRKTLANNFQASGLSREQALHILSRADVDPQARAETLGVDDFVRLTQALQVSNAKRAT